MQNGTHRRFELQMAALEWMILDIDEAGF